MPKEFVFYLKKGIARKCSPDMQRAMFLKKEAQNSMEGLKERVEKIGMNNKNANSIVKDCYDIIMELVRARLYLKGYNCSGPYAHEAEVSYLVEEAFPAEEVSFLNELRRLRNSVTYFGKILDKDYAAKAYDFIVKIYPKLVKLASA